MSFEASLLVDKLAKLNESPDSIQTLSKWIMHHHRHAREIAALWADYTAKQAPLTQYLALVYLANEVMQRTRKRSDVFSNEFASNFPAVLPLIYGKLNSELRAKLVRVVNILKERNCLPEKTYLQLRKSLESLALPSPRRPPTTSASASSSTSGAATAAASRSDQASGSGSGGTPSFRPPTHPASALRPLTTTTTSATSATSATSPPPPPPLASPSLDPIHNIARDIVACKDLVSPLLDPKTRAAMSPAAIRALITPEFLKKYKHAVSALEFVHQQQTASVKQVEQVLAELDRPPSATSSTSQSPAVLKHARTDPSSSNGDHDPSDEDPRQLKRPRASPPVVAPPPVPTLSNGGALDHFAFMTTMAPPPLPTGAAASPVPDPLELLKKLTSGSTASGSPFSSILESAASPSLPAPPAPGPAAPTGRYSPTPSATATSSSFDPMHFLSMSPPPPPGLPVFSAGEFGAMPMPPGLMPPPPPPPPPPPTHMWAASAGADAHGVPVPGLAGAGAGSAGFVAVPTILGSGARPAVGNGEGEADRTK